MKIDEALDKIREYSKDHNLTPSQMIKIFNIGIIGSPSIIKLKDGIIPRIREDDDDEWAG